MARARDESCNHAYGLHIVHCPECGSHIASRCPRCRYESRYDEDHRSSCPLGARASAGTKVVIR